MCKCFGIISIIITVLLSGCSSTGMMTARHNGKMYWNPGDCPKFNYYPNNPDVLNCFKDGEATGVQLYPADQQQTNNYRYQQESTQSALDGLNESLNQYNRDARDRTQQLMSLPKW